jgi:phage terminase small subunit
MSLTAKQQRFVDEYLLDSNGKQAAIRAGYSPRSAEVQASKLLSKGKVSEEVKKRRQEVVEAIEASAVDVLRALWREANATGKGSAHAARVSALSWLGKYHALFTEKVSVEGELPVIVVKRGESE